MGRAGTTNSTNSTKPGRGRAGKRSGAAAQRCRGAEGADLARDGHVIAATQKFSDALAFDPTLSFSPQQRAGELAAEPLLEEGEQLARDGEVINATQKFSDALAFDPTLSFSPQQRAGELAAEPLLEEGEQLAQAGHVITATQKFSDALAFDPTLEFTPTVRAKQVHIRIGIKGEELAFDTDSLNATISEGQDIHIIFSNTSQTQEHTFILLNHADMDKAQIFNAAAAAYSGYIPLDDAKLMETVLSYVPIKQPGEQGEITFSAPPPGDYLYICTVPGHFPAGDYGTLTILSP